MNSPASPKVPATIHPDTEAQGVEACWLAEEERGLWDQFIANHHQATVFHSYDWKLLVEDCFPHIKGEILALKESKTGAVLAGLPVYTVKSALLGRRLVSIPFATLGGPLLSAPGQLTPLLPHVLAKVEGAGAKRFELRGLRFSSQVENTLLTPAKNHLHHYLEFPASAGDLKSLFSRTIRREITKAEKMEVTVLADNSSEALDTFCDFQQQARRRLGLPVYPKRFFTGMFRHLPKSSLSILIASKQGLPIGALLSFDYKEWAVAEHIGISPEGKKLGVSHALFWHDMVRARNKGLRNYSFGRTSPEDAGLLQFKRSWGTVEEPLITMGFPAARESGGTPGAAAAGRAARFVFRNLPVPLARAAGTLFFRHWA